MQVSIETISELERRMTVGVPAAVVESAVMARLQEAAGNVRLNGFRKGKIPLKVIITITVFMPSLLYYFLFII